MVGVGGGWGSDSTQPFETSEGDVRGGGVTALGPPQRLRWEKPV